VKRAPGVPSGRGHRGASRQAASNPNGRTCEKAKRGGLGTGITHGGGGRGRRAASGAEVLGRVWNSVGARVTRWIGTGRIEVPAGGWCSAAGRRSQDAGACSEQVRSVGVGFSPWARMRGARAGLGR
jgi:hypothetical protein